MSLIEALGFTTPVGRAMAGLLAVFAAFESDILRERFLPDSIMPEASVNVSAAAAIGRGVRRCPPVGSRRYQQIRDRQATRLRQNVRPPYPGPQGSVNFAAIRSLAGSSRWTPRAGRESSSSVLTLWGLRAWIGGLFGPARRTCRSYRFFCISSSKLTSSVG